MEYVLLVGFCSFNQGADFFVEGSSSLARILRIPSVIIGLTIVAIGNQCTRKPLSVSMQALAGEQ